MLNLKKLRENAGISQQSLATAIGSTKQNIYNYENGYFEPDLDTLKALAKYFDVSVDYLIQNSDLELNSMDVAIIRKFASMSPEVKNAFYTIISSSDFLNKHSEEE